MKLLVRTVSAVVRLRPNPHGALADEMPRLRRLVAAHGRPVAAPLDPRVARRFQVSAPHRYSSTHHHHGGWRRGVVLSGVRRMNEVNARRALLVRGWVTVFGRVYHLGM